MAVAGLSGKALLDAEPTVLRGLATISEHAAQRGGGGPRDLLRPELFPIDRMFRLLIDLIGEARPRGRLGPAARPLTGRALPAGDTSGRVQIACVRALLETAQCAAGGDVSLDDVYCLLAGLQSPKEVGRAAAGRARVGRSGGS